MLRKRHLRHQNMSVIRRLDRENAWWVDFRYNRRRVRRPSPVQTRQGAERYERMLRSQFLRQEERGGDPLGGDLTPFSSFADRWMQEYVLVKNRPSSQRSKRLAIRNYFLPAFGHTPLSKITEARIDQFTASLRSRGLSAKTINNLLSMLRTCLSLAVRWDVLSRLPHFTTLQVTAPGYKYLSESEVVRLVRAAPEGYWRTLLVFLLHTGCRFGEAAALQWDDLELEGPNARVRIQRGVSLGYLGPTKNGRVRDIPLTPDVIRCLRSLPKTRPHVFALLDGTLPCPCHSLRYLHRICDRAEVKRISWHVLRHTFATELSARQVPLRVVQELLGHASIVMTCRYAHVADRALQSAVALLPTLSWGAPASARDRRVMEIYPHDNKLM